MGQAHPRVSVAAAANAPAELDVSGSGTSEASLKSCPARQLNRPWPAHLIERAEAAARHARSRIAGRKRARRLPEQAAAEGVGWRTEARPVEEIEGFDTELK